VNPDICESVAPSFQIDDKIHEVVTKQGMSHKNLALLLGKKESEVSKWMLGTYDFTTKTLASIERMLKAPITNVIH
jgi:Helix-turn-helix.